ncbi:MAG: hypothetical protein E6H67_04120 [Betaproteobacteria bacterium]|nr:MAG: hypothetical protein E6H67_04120 [Betaproteobacteria bacterium]
MKRFGIALLWAVGGYLVGAFGGGWLVTEFSSNMHDRSVEAAMSGVFFFGPVLAVVAFIAAMLWRRSVKNSGAG